MTTSIVVIDDDADIRSMLDVVLRLEGFDVKAFGSGEEALAWLDAGHPVSLLILDLMMPGMNGWELRAELDRRPAHKDLPVLVLSGAGEDPRIAGTGYLEKPIDLDVLLREIERRVRRAA